MAGSVLGIAFSLLLLASVIQGAKNAELLFNETMEAEVGQNISITCFMKDFRNDKIVHIKWTKNGGTKLALYDLVHGQHQFWPNVTIQAQKDDANRLTASDLYLPLVNKWDSGIYSCEITTFPLDVFTSETKLTVKDEMKLLCNVSEVVEVYFGDNATIQCRVNSNAQYTWTKNSKLVSENECLELWQVTEAHAGVYKLTVNTGDKSLHKDFIISVLATTTILRTDPTESTQGPSDSPHTSTAIPVTTTLTTDIHWITQPNSSTVIAPPAGHVTPSTTLTSVSVPSSHDTQTNHLINSSKSNIAVTALTSTQRMASDQTKNRSRFNSQSTEDIFSVSTNETKTSESILTTGHTGGLSAGSKTSTATEKVTERSHMFIIVLLLLFTAVVFILYRRQVIKKRMDLPPPFKPPPPPVKYTAARRSETQLLPTSRCNSLSASMEPIID